ncbi:enoyl-CoA hydratase [Nocardia cyriacigeorgica]|uniref:Enoyl-CoA hydratase n=1 Tax=Nocardia cyriacigeorgica TaxID=135487 RepID=A0A5R8P9M9_9NOCA|nr:enoyl-CoA hydratase [Nocardia cyriacigeorgica]TLG03797.1 enoyl-CoA hydratase [Nocardia cyriacigeorgica]
MVSDGSSSPTVGFTAVRDRRVLRVTISNPGRKNAISYQTMVALGDTFLALADDPGVRVVLLTGDGADFCTGADLAADTNGITPEMTMDAANRLVRAIVNAPVPVIARIRGAAAGVGVGIALAADLVYAADDSYLLLAFINIGLMPDGGAAALVAAAAGRPLATEMALLGKRLPAPAAREAGLLTAALPVDELDATVQAAVDKIAHGPRRALELTKKALNIATLRALDEVLDAEKTGQVELLESADFREGAAAMLGKRKAVFTD